MLNLLERDSELARLHAAYEAAAEGRGGVMFISGEAGVGKSILVERFTGGIDAPARVVFGRCDALSIPRALGPFLDVASALGVHHLGDREGLLDSLVAELRDGPPTVIVVEDAHWADLSTVDLVTLLGRRAVDLSLLLLVTYRELEVGAGHPLRQALGNLATASGAIWMGLRPLSLDAVRTLAEPFGASAEKIFELTGGNPFYVTESLAAPAGTVATSVRLVVLARASRLSAEARAVLDAASIVPGRTEGWLLDVLCGADPAAAEECLTAGVMRADGGEYAFRHELARLAIEHELSDRTRRELHQRASQSLVGRHGADPERTAFHAELAGDDDLLARAAADACRHGLTRGENRSAVRFGEVALRLAEHLDSDEVADVQVALATAFSELGRIDDGIRLAGEAVAHWRRVGDGRREAIALGTLSFLTIYRGRTEDAIVGLRRAVELLEQFPPGPDLLEAYVRMTTWHMLARDRDAAVDWGERAAALAEQLGDMANMQRALMTSGTAEVMTNRFQGLERIRRGIEAARAQGNHALVVLGLGRIGAGCGELRRYDVAVPALVEGFAYAAEHHVEARRLFIAAWLARCRLDLGEWGEAETLAADVLTGPASHLYARLVALNTLGWLRARRGDPDVWPLLDEALAIARQIGHLQRLWPCAVARAEAGWLAGDIEPHVALLEEQVEVAAKCRHQVAVGELGVWLHRAGRPVPDAGAEPFASWIRGDYRGAASGFDSMGCPYEAASALACSGNSRSLRDALATFEGLGAAPAARRVADELRSRGVRVSPRSEQPATDNPGGLSNREVEVIRLVAAGFTNPQIGAALYISRKTAEHHVSNILFKLGVSTRAEAASTAVRLGVAAG